jgi:protein CrcB
MIEILVVGLGGAIGAILRYSISLIPYKNTFPVLTLITNLLGAILIGSVVGISVKNNWPKNLTLFFKTGVCGGFTTFSTFSLEANNLFQINKPVMAIIYIILSVVLCLLGVMFGIFISSKS